MINRTRTALFLCDIQQRFQPLIHNFPAVLHTASKMIHAGSILDLPLVVTEQYPKALGRTVSELESVITEKYSSSENLLKAEKTQFSMVTPQVGQWLKSRRHPIENVILFGIESHVCVLQTALQLRSSSPPYDVYILADGVSSSHPAEVPMALQRMREAGCKITTSESIMFELLGDKETEGFKAISALVKETQAKKGLHNALLAPKL